MNKVLEQLKDKKIAVVGLGRNNIKLAEFLKNNGFSFDVIDAWKSPIELSGKLEKFEVIFRTPGLPYLSQAVQSAKTAGVQILSQTKLFFKLCPAPIIGITGTKGKGTTSSLIAKILEVSGKKVWLAGNIGKDPFEFLDQIKSSDFVVLELSSFQLQDLEQSPHVSVVLNITADHQNHHKSMEEYLQAKSQILSHQRVGDFAVLNPNLPEWFKHLGDSKKIILDPQEAKKYSTKLFGKHNWENISAAVNAVKVLGIPNEAIIKAVADFEPLPHRLKFVREVDGVKFVDDAYSTNIDPTIAAINSIEGGIVLIIGGYDKGLDFKALGEKISKSASVRGLVVIGQVADKILASIQGYQGKILTGGKGIGEIVAQARSLAQAGDTILFSPATASFDLFKNETDRGEQFVSEVLSL